MALLQVIREISWLTPSTHFNAKRRVQWRRRFRWPASQTVSTAQHSRFVVKAEEEKVSLGACAKLSLGALKQIFSFSCLFGLLIKQALVLINKKKKQNTRSKSLISFSLTISATDWVRHLVENLDHE